MNEVVTHLIVGFLLLLLLGLFLNSCVPVNPDPDPFAEIIVDGRG